jgi:phosphoglycerate dehydrogenase-like enzyme
MPHDDPVDPVGLAGTRPTLRINGALPAGFLDRIRNSWPEARIVTGDVPADAVLIWDYTLPYRLEPVPRWVHTRAVGIDDVLLPYAGRTVLTNGRGTKGPAIGEYVVAAILAHYKRLPELVRAGDSRTWHEPFVLTELGGKTVGIVGTGDNGRAIARLLRPFGVGLIGVRRRSDPVPEMDEVHTVADLPKVLPRCDVLVLATPLTPLTRGLIGAAELDLLPAGALLVNIGRGAVADEPAMVAALRHGRLGGAALDVFGTEPLPANSPLWRAPNVLISPHCADITAPTVERCLVAYLENVRLVRAGRAPRWIVDPAAGY